MTKDNRTIELISTGVTLTMYAKNQHAAPKVDYPYQEQRQDSGEFIPRETKEPPSFSANDIEELRKALESIANAKN